MCSLCVRSATLALEAVGEFWHCVLDFGQPCFLQEVSGVREMWVDFSLSQRSVGLESNILYLFTSFRGQGQRA